MHFLVGQINIYFKQKLLNIIYKRQAFRCYCWQLYYIQKEKEKEVLFLTKSY